MSTDQTGERKAPELDAMLSRSEAAAWLRMSERDLAEKSSGPRPVIPAFKPGHKTVLYHPRTVIATLARRAGVPNDLITASFGVVTEAAREP